MEVNNKPIIWLIDESPRELRNNVNLLKRLFPETLEVKGLKALKNLQDYIPVLSESRTVCIITDQRLKVTGEVNYTGIELAEFIRGLNTKIPIYILTNFADDKDEFIGGEWSVEDVIPKSYLNEPYQKKIIASRLLRRIEIFEDILSDSEKRIHDILKRGLDGNLTESDLQELEELHLQRNSVQILEEMAEVRQINQLIQEHEELIEKMHHYLTKEEPKYGK